MKASKLVVKINELIEQYGDLPVRFDGTINDCDVDKIIVYDEEGNTPDEFRQAHEIYLHGKVGR